MGTESLLSYTLSYRQKNFRTRRRPRMPRRATPLILEELDISDALETNDSAVQILGDEQLRTIARELAEDGARM